MEPALPGVAQGQPDVGAVCTQTCGSPCPMMLPYLSVAQVAFNFVLWSSSYKDCMFFLKDFNIFSTRCRRGAALRLEAVKMGNFLHSGPFCLLWVILQCFQLVLLSFCAYCCYLWTSRCDGIVLSCYQSQNFEVCFQSSLVTPTSL